jgi:hypothetical protein
MKNTAESGHGRSNVIWRKERSSYMPGNEAEDI